MTTFREFAKDEGYEPAELAAIINISHNYDLDEVVTMRDATEYRKLIHADEDPI